MGVNKVILVGNVGRDPEFRALPSGTNLAKFSLATTEQRFKDQNGEPHTEWHFIVAWGKTAEFVQRFVTKGRQLYVEGRIRTRSYEKDGQRKYSTEIHADQIEFVGTRPGGADGGQPGGMSDLGPGEGGGPPGTFGEEDDVPF